MPLDTQLSVGEAAFLGGMLGSIITAAVITGLVFSVLMIIANWKIFEKAGEKGWKALIPIYNTYIMFKIVDMTNWFWALIAVSIIGSIILSVSGYPTVAVTVDEMQARLEASSNPTIIITGLVMMVVSLWASILYVIRTAKVFGKNGWFAAGLFFLTPIFWLILAFGKAKYNKKNLAK